MRVPSGPREYPGSPGKQRQASISDGTNTQPGQGSPGQGFRSTARAFQRNNADAFYFNASGDSNPHARLNSFGRSNLSDLQYRNIATENLPLDTSPTGTPTRPTLSGRKASTGSGLVELDFLPDVNFDDFQTSIKNYDGTSPLLSDFPAVDGGRIIPRDSYEGMARPTFGGLKEQTQQKNGVDGVSRTQSLRQRLAGGRQASGTQQQKDIASSSAKDSFRNRRQSSMTAQQSVAAATGVPGGPAAAAAGKPPRKSVGPGILSSLGKSSYNAQQPSVTPSGELTSLKPSLVRNASLSKAARRTTIQPSSSSTLSNTSDSTARVSTLQATTQSRQNKVKSLQPPPRSDGGGSDPNTPNKSSTNSSKGGNQRAHTPSSSGNRRQSLAASGRASGLGARTISPTDTRRLKRISMMQVPPLPTGPSPGEEMPDPMSNLTYAAATANNVSASTIANSSAPSKLPELPRLAQPSPSLIPRKTNSATPSSARESPDATARQPFTGGVSLSSKSSYQSLFDRSNTASTSRLPTPRARINTSAAGFASTTSTSSARDSYTDSNAWSAGEETEQFFDVPPVPAIPKAYESPRDTEHPPFFSTSLKSSQHAFSADSVLGESSRLADVAGLPTPRFLPTPRTSLDVPAETPRKRSGEMTRPSHNRTNTLERANANGTLTAAGATSGATSGPALPAPPRTFARAQPDPTGRRNVNLQPLRLPPLNLMPLNTRVAQSSGGLSATQPRPSQEIDSRDDFMSFTTPEPKRGMAKTPSTPMTASKATFFSRSKSHDDSQAGKNLRSSSSHFALRDVLGMDENGNHLNMSTKWYNWGEDSDTENYLQGGVPVPGRQQTQQGRNAITPFSSGSLPKNSGEFVRNAGLRGRPSGEYPQHSAGSMEDEYSLGLGGYDGLPLNSSKRRTRAQTNTTMNSTKSGLSTEMNLDSPSEAEARTEKKEAGGGLRRKLSLGWRRSSSKAATQGDDKASPKDDERQRSRLQKRNAKNDVAAGGVNEMPPPKLPASATWSGDVPSLPSSARPSLDTARSHNKRKSQVPTSVSSIHLSDTGEQPQQQQGATNGATGGVKTRSLHSEQPTPVTNSSSSNAARASSWGNLGTTLRPGAKPAGPQGPRHRLSPSTISALVKDKDDLTADDEMQRLSRKRKDVDTAARESDELKKRAIARSPVTAEHVLHDRSLTGGSMLNVFERGEIVDHETDGIYFTGAKSARKIIGTLAPSPNPSSNSGSGAGNKDGAGAGGSNNFGYDDERGDYNIVLGDHLAYRYEVVDVLGKGSFGQVVRCVDHKEGGVVAVKIIRNKKRFHQQALVEVGILGRLREWVRSHIPTLTCSFASTNTYHQDPDGSNATLSITSSFYFRSHLCIVTPCLSINLYELIRAHNFVGFSLPLIRRFARQLLACLCLLQTKRIIHCDLKPENILLCEGRKADVRVIDFGSSCREEEKVYTYIQSRFYRSPEVILGSSYGLGIDMWSLGCILAELLTGYPIFPGENEQEQLACIMEIFGPPDRHLVERCTRKKLFFDSVGKPRVTVSSKGRRRRPSSKTLQQALKTEDEAFVDFVARCLRWDPDRRIKPTDAITHPFITNQPFHQRPGIPEEARRAAKVRNTTAVPSISAASAQAIPSPVKRGPASSVNTFGQPPAVTPARDRTRPLPETPQTALRNGIPAPNPSQGSPIKAASNANRRHSTVATAGAAAMAGSKRASNGAVLAGQAPPGAVSQAPGGPSGNLAQIAARESMGATNAGGGRWRG